MSSTIAFALAALLAADESQSGASVSISQLAAQPQTGEASAAAQISNVGHPAESPPNLSSTADSRALTAAPVGGRDRCDPAAPQEGVDCSNRLESRSNEYAKPAPAPVTPEARLLILTGKPDAAVLGGAGAQTGVDALAGSAAAELATVLQGQAKPDAAQGPNSAASASVVILTPH